VRRLPRRELRWPKWLSVVLILIGLPFSASVLLVIKEPGGPLAEALCWDCWVTGCHHHHGNTERSPVAWLKTLATAEVDFRSNDRDGNGRNDFWRDDVAGLFSLVPRGWSHRIRLIALSLAEADARPVHDVTALRPRAPLRGYWFMAIRHADEVQPDRGSRFAFCAFPDVYGPEGGKRWTYVIDESGTVCRADLGHGRGVDVFPSEDELRQCWSRMD